jgi:chromosome segregation ATPase
MTFSVKKFLLISTTLSMFTNGYISFAYANDEVEALTGSIADTITEIKNIELSIKDEELKLNDIQENQKIFLLQINENETILENLKKNQSNTTYGLAEIQSKKSKLQLELNNLKSKKIMLTMQLETMEPQLQATAEILSGIDISITKNSSAINDVKENVEILKVKKQSLEDRINLNNQRITKARSLMQNDYKPIADFENVKNQVFALEMTIENLNKQIDDMDSDVASSEGKLNRFERACRREPACKEALNL